MRAVWQDIRFGVRLLMRSPAFALSAISMLALGVGSSTAIFGIVESVLLRPLPYPDSGRIVTLSEIDRAGQRLRVSLPDFRDWVERVKSYEAIAAMSGDSTTVVTSRRSRRISAVRFYGDPQRVFGVPIGHGRALTSEEVRTGAPLAIVPNGFAGSLFDDPARAVGEGINLGGRPLTIAGVLEAAADERTDLFVPAAAFGPDASSRNDYSWEVVARLREGVSVDSARTELQTIDGSLRRERGGDGPVVGAAVSSLLDDTVRTVRPALLLLLAAGGLLLLIGCANVANLLLARGLERRREIAVRQVLGAGRGRIVCQMVVESLPLSLSSAIAGIVLAQWSFSTLLAMVPFGIPRRGDIAMDAGTLIFGVGVSLVAGLFFAIAPALQSPGRQLTTQLTNAGRTASGRDGALRTTLVAAQFALALAVLSCAGLLTKSFVRLAHVEIGFDVSETLVAETELPADRLRDGRESDDVLATRDGTHRRVARSPGGGRGRIRTIRRTLSERHDRTPRRAGSAGLCVVGHRNRRLLRRAEDPVASRAPLRGSRFGRRATGGGDQPGGRGEVLARSEPARQTRAMVG